MAQKILRNYETTIFLLLTDGNNFCQSLSAQQLHVKGNKYISPASIIVTGTTK